jgi:hypothetical protein
VHTLPRAIAQRRHLERDGDLDDVVQASDLMGNARAQRTNRTLVVRKSGAKSPLEILVGYPMRRDPDPDLK